MPKAIPDSIRELAKALYIQGVKMSVIVQQCQVKEKAIRNWVKRGNWPDLASRATQPLIHKLQRGLAVETANTLQAMGDQIRDKLSRELLDQVQLLTKQPARDVSDLATVKGIQGRASVVKTIAETAAVVHDWGSQSSAGLVLVGELSREPGETPLAAVDISASVEPAQLQPGADTTTSSVPEASQTLSEDNPLSLQG